MPERPGLTTVPFNFLGLDERFSRYDDARFAVLPVPYDAASSYLAGARHGPAAIISASHHAEWFDEELERECHTAGIATLDPLEPVAAGPQAMHEVIYKAARRIVRDGKFLFGLGGDHSITSGLVRGVMSRHRRLSVLQIDAHADLRNTFQGSPYSHASVMRRVLEMNARIVSVGVRAICAEDHRAIRRHSVETIPARECHAEDGWIDRVINALGEKVYVTVDIDAFDPAFAPGTGTPEPGGLDWYQVTGLLRLVAAERQVVGADIVEVLPIPGQVVTEFLAARLAYKLMSYVAFPE